MIPDKIQKTCNWLIARAYPMYNEECGRCAKFIREGVEFGFDPVKLERHNSAKDYGSSYEKIGFKKLTEFSINSYIPEIGDIAIIHYEPHGHICLYAKGTDLKTGRDVECWISDFRQRDLYGGKIRKKNPPVSIYRFS